MRKLFLALAVTIVFFFTSCQSSVGITYMVPSEIDMGSYRNIALASTVPYEGFPRPSRYIRTLDPLARHGYPYILTTYTRGLKDDVAEYATEKIYSTLSDSGYFSILSPSVTDKILDAGSVGLSTRDAFLERGIDAVLIPRIENMSIDEYIYSRTRYETRTDSSGKEYEVEITNFYYDADYFLTLSYSIVDVRTERIIASRKFVVDDSDNFRITSPSFISSYPERSFRRMIDSTMSRITRQLVPLQTTAEITLMDNKPKDKDVEVAYDALKDGNFSLSSSLFLENYKTDKHIPSGYNAALITAAMGDIDGAIEIADMVYEETGSADVSSLRSRLISIRKSNEESIRQIEGGGDSTLALPSETASIYDVLRR